MHASDRGDESGPRGGNVCCGNPGWVFLVSCHRDSARPGGSATPESPALQPPRVSTLLPCSVAPACDSLSLGLSPTPSSLQTYREGLGDNGAEGLECELWEESEA